MRAKLSIDCIDNVKISLLKHLKGPCVFFFGLQHIFRQQAHGAHFPQLPCQLLLANDYVGKSRWRAHTYYEVGNRHLPAQNRQLAILK